MDIFIFIFIDKNVLMYTFSMQYYLFRCYEFLFIVFFLQIKIPVQISFDLNITSLQKLKMFPLAINYNHID